MASSEPHPIPYLPLSQKGDSGHWPQLWRPECDCCLEPYKTCSRKGWQGAREVVYRRHPRCPHVSLLLSPCTLVKTLQDPLQGPHKGAGKGLSPLFYKQDNGVGGSSLLQSQGGTAAPARALGPASSPPIPGASSTQLCPRRGMGWDR